MAEQPVYLICEPPPVVEASSAAGFPAVFEAALPDVFVDSNISAMSLPCPRCSVVLEADREPISGFR